MKTNRGFDVLSSIYDGLARTVFGKSVVESQIVFLNQVPADSKILILGGGTGWLLEAIEETNRSCEIWYVELSAGMINRARKRKLKNPVHFIQGTEEDIPMRQFDVVMTNFYLDLFSDKKLKEVIERINQRMKPAAYWLITDFVEGGNWWQSVLLKLMYRFFRVACGIEGKRLPDWSFSLQAAGWKETQVAYRYGKFIKSALWKRD